MKIFILLPYGGGSHEYWAKSIAKISLHNIKIFQLPGRYWKWRMHGAASYFSTFINEREEKPDLILTTSMMNIPEFRGQLNNEFKSIPIHLYFHENQFAYPVSKNDPDKNSERLEHFQFIQIQSFINADQVYFNSEYNQKTFLEGSRQLLKKLPDFKEHLTSGLERVSKIWKIHIDIDELEDVRGKKKPTNEIVFIWNHRWENDKNPVGFFDLLRKIKQKGTHFKLIICGKQTPNPIFSIARKEFSEEIIHFGEVNSRQKYLELLSKATHSIITSFHDFYGISALELLFSGVKTYFPKRLVYSEHFDVAAWDSVSYDLETIMDKIESSTYPSFESILSPLIFQNEEIKKQTRLYLST